MKRTILFFATAVFILTGCKTGDDIADELQEMGNTKVDFSYTINERTVTFTNLCDDKIQECLWDFGDNNISQSMRPTHTYEKDGKYSVHLKASWSYKGHILHKGCTKDITIGGGSDPTPQPSVIDYTVTRISPLMFSFDNNSTGFDSYRWDFGDGMWSESKNTVHTYEKTGEYIATLTATANGKNYNKSTTVKVTQPDVYFTGFVIYHIPYDNKYYKLVFKDDNLLPSSWDFQTTYTPLLSEYQLPYTREWTEPKLLESINNHTYYTIQVMRNNSTSGGTDTQCMKQKLMVSDILSGYLPEYILQTETGSVAIGILMGYDF